MTQLITSRPQNPNTTKVTHERPKNWGRRPQEAPKRKIKGNEESQDAFDHDKGQKSAILGRRLHWIFRIFSTGFFLLLSRFSVQFSQEIPPKCGENCPISVARGRSFLSLSSYPLGPVLSHLEVDPPESLLNHFWVAIPSVPK